MTAMRIQGVIICACGYCEARSFIGASHSSQLSESPLIANVSQHLTPRRMNITRVGHGLQPRRVCAVQEEASIVRRRHVCLPPLFPMYVYEARGTDLPNTSVNDRCYISGCRVLSRYLIVIDRKSVV